MLALLLLSPVLLLGLCTIAAMILGGRGEKMAELEKESRLYHLPAPTVAEDKLKASG
jgi:hypothetical protein